MGKLKKINKVTVNQRELVKPKYRLEDLFNHHSINSQLLQFLGADFKKLMMLNKTTIVTMNFLPQNKYIIFPEIKKVVEKVH